MTIATSDVLATQDDSANRRLSIQELDAIAAGMGFPRLPPHLPPHFPHAPSPLWSGVVYPVVTGYRLF